MYSFFLMLQIRKLRRAMDIVPSVFFRDMPLFVCVNFKHSKKRICILYFLQYSSVHPFIYLFVQEIVNMLQCETIDFSSVTVVSHSLWPYGLQHARLSCPSTPRACWNSCPLSQWCHATISSSGAPSPPAFNLSLHQGLFQWVSSPHQVAKVLEFQL